MIAYDTGERVTTLTTLAEAIERIPRRSLFFHVHEARRRTAGQTDDFSLWLEGIEADPELVARIRGIDFYFLNLTQLRQELLDVLRLGFRNDIGCKGDCMKLLDRYEEVVGHQEVQRLRQLADRLKGMRVVHVNSTKAGGGVAEILGWMVPLMNELGLEARWEVIQGPPEFYRVTKAFHNGLQGFRVSLKPSDFQLHLDVNRENAQRLNLEADVVFVHDPQPVYLPQFTPKGQVTRWVWRCHIDASRPHRAVWKHITAAIPHYQAAVFSMAAFTRPMNCPIFLIPPSIDPLSEKNGLVSESERLEIIANLGIDPLRPMLLQVSRFDRFKDPLGVIAAYRLLKPYYPGLQLALAGGPADDDPEGADVLREVMERSEDDPDLKVLMLPPDSHRAINALQRSAIVVLQKSLKEGFGLVTRVRGGQAHQSLKIASRVSEPPRHVGLDRASRIEEIEITRGILQSRVRQFQCLVIFMIVFLEDPGQVVQDAGVLGLLFEQVPIDLLGTVGVPNLVQRGGQTCLRVKRCRR